MTGKMKYFFVQDYRHKYRFFSSEPLSQIEVHFSRWEKMWESAKKKLLLLPHKVLLQEQAFERILKSKENNIKIFYSGRLEGKRAKIKFFFFIQRQRTKHIIYLLGEILLLPISGLAAFLPGPNVFFGVLALLIITHWQAFRGINKLSKKDIQLRPDPYLMEWEQAIRSQNDQCYDVILNKIGDKYHIPKIKKVLWK
ncbi:MAG: hypothetical protein U9O50_09460 [Acidobacteriota bacterium]|nr:hypothetical protein [Acidobacteriota bacterium]